MYGYKNKLKLILRLIADDLCLRILLELMKSDLYSDELSRRLKVPKSTMWKKLKELEEAGIVESYFAKAKVGRRVKMYKFKDRRLGLLSVSEFLRKIKEEG